MSSAVIAGAMTRPSLLAALAATTLTACAPALVEYPRARAPFAVPDVALELPAGPEVGGPQQGWVDEVLVGGDEPGVAHHGTQLEDPTADFSPDEEPTTEGQCAAVMAQSGWCASLRDAPGVGAVVGFIGLDDGAVCDAMAADVGASTLTATSLAVAGTQAAWCDGSSVIHTVDLATGDVTTSASTAVSCAGMTEAQGGLAVLPQGLGRDVTWYANVDEVLSGGGVSWPVRPWASRLAADATTVYAALHETDMIERWLPTGVELEPLELDWFGYVHGLDAVAGGRFVVLDSARDLRVFDADSGDTLDTIALTGSWSGLACFPAP